MDHVVVDVEIQKTIEDTPGGWDSTDQLGVSVACLWEARNGRMRVYGPDDLDELRNRLLRADRISGYNIWNFDFPVIWGLSKPTWENWLALPIEEREKFAPHGVNLKAVLSQKCDDLLRRIWTAQGLNPNVFVPLTHSGYKLDDVAAETIGTPKIGHGAEAPKWWQAGLVHKLINYCADDVALERDLVEFVDRYSYIVRHGRQIFIPDWQPGKG